MRQLLLIKAILFLSFAVFSQEQVQCGDELGSFEGVFSNSSSSAPVISNLRGRTPKVGAKGELSVYFETDFLGGVMTGNLVVATAEVTAVSNGRVTLKVLEEHSSITINGRKKNHFVKGKEILFNIHEYDTPRLETLTDRSGIPTARGLMVCGNKIGEWEYFDENGLLEKKVNLNDDGEIDGIYKEYHPNGQLAYKVEYDDGDPEGGYLKWYPNGELKERGEYDYSGDLDDIQETFYPDGTKKSKRDYDGGPYFEWYENGQVAVQGEYSWTDDRTGVWKEFYETGEPKSSVEYTSGEMRGVYESWYSNGNLREKGNYYYGGKKEDAWNQFYENGNPKNLITYDRGELDGPYRSFYEDGKVHIDCEYYDGELSQKYTEYYSDGKPKLKGEYSRTGELKTGVWAEYFEEGGLRSSQAYQNNEPAGSFISYYTRGIVKEKGNKFGEILRGNYALYYESGALRVEGQYDQDGTKTEVWITYFENGKVDTKGTYSNGKKTGKWIEHDEAGKKLKIKYD
ncbi:MAG: hypothetical protein QNK23_01555 [Crocinitomicaceae bacterium]|nr:hypothetical protein [Crocinitomicaceae bacterium]